MESKTKKTVRKTKTEFTVDLTNAETSFDVMLSFAIARFKAEKPLTEDDLGVIVIASSMATLDILSSGIYAILVQMIDTTNDYICKKKDPWYKRIWKKIKYAFTW